MNLSDFQRRMIVSGIALFFILLGLAQGVFKFNINHKIMDEFNFFLMLAAFMVLFSGKKKPDTEEDKKQEEKEKIES